MFVVLAICGYVLLLAVLMRAGRQASRSAPVTRQRAAWVVPGRLVDEMVADLERYANGARG